jgi:hypothetical protein
VTGVAAAALIVVAAAVTGALTGSIGELTSFGRQPASASASARASAQSPGSQGPLVTGAARVPIPRPKATTASAPATPRPTSGPGSLCLEYFEYSFHPAPGGAAAWFALEGQLSKLAGGPFEIYGYCLRYLDDPLAGRGGSPMIRAGTGGSGASGRGSQGTGSLSPATVSPVTASPASRANQGAGTAGQGTGTAGQGAGTADESGGTADQVPGGDPGAGVAKP